MNQVLITFYAKHPCKEKYQLLIYISESTGLKYLSDSKAFTGYSNDMDDIYKNIEKTKQKILIVFDDIIVDILSNNKLNSIVTKLFIRGRKLTIYLAFITQSYFAVPKNID